MKTALATALLLMGPWGAGLPQALASTLHLSPPQEKGCWMVGKVFVDPDSTEGPITHSGRTLAGVPLCDDRQPGENQDPEALARRLVGLAMTRQIASKIDVPVKFKNLEPTPVRRGRYDHTLSFEVRVNGKEYLAACSSGKKNTRNLRLWTVTDDCHLSELAGSFFTHGETRPLSLRFGSVQISVDKHLPLSSVTTERRPASSTQTEKSYLIDSDGNFIENPNYLPPKAKTLPPHRFRNKF